jgi:glucuronoarabinoxylan endo-1,4-beta-xylanase
VLNENSYDAYAAHLKSFADYMANQGVPLFAVSIQNEPDATVTYESCSWDGTQMLNFCRDNAVAIGRRIMMPESQNFARSLSDPTLNDSEAAGHVGIIAGHIYGGGLAPYPLAVGKGKELWMTEHLDLDTSWAGVLGTGMEIHNCMNAGMQAYVWWYIVRYYGPISEDGNVSKRGYVMSQYARFVRPGFRKIACDAVPQRNVYVTAYKDSSSSRVVIVALNRGTVPLEQEFSLTGGTMTSFNPYTTSHVKNCLQGNSITVTKGGFAVALDPSSITTFVSK